MATTKLWTIEEVARLPDDAFRYALIRGVLYRMPPPKARDGRIISTMTRHVGNFVDERHLGVIYDQSGFIFTLDPDTLLGPDLSFVRQDRVPDDEDAYPILAPDLVVEVVSPSQSGPSIAEKTAIYLEAGVRLVWIFEPDQRVVLVHRANGTRSVLTERDEIDGEDVLPGFRMRVGRFFP